MTRYSTKAGIELSAFEQLPASGTYRARFDPDEVTASMAAVAALAEVMNVDPMELDPLFESINPDALDTLVGLPDSPNGALQVRFSASDHEITARSDGTIEIAPNGRDAAANRNGSTSIND